MKVIWIIVLVLAVVAGWFIVVPVVAPGVTEKTVVRDAQVTVGDTCAIMNQSDLALMMYENALSANTSDTTILKKKGALLIRCGRVSEAETVYQQVLSQTPNDTTALIKTGDSLARQGNLTGAIAYYNAALALNPSDATTLLKKGDAYLVMSMAETQRLQNIARNLSKQPGTSASPPATSAQSLDQMDSYQQAMASYQKAMEIDPKLSVIVSTRVLSASQNQVSSYQDILNNMGS